MFQLLKTEWLKIRKYPAFWLMMSLTALSYPGINYMFYKTYENALEKSRQAATIAKNFFGNPFSFPEAWHTIAYFSSFFVFIPAVIVIMLMTNEYSYKTQRQNIIDGWSRSEFMTAKMMDVLIISVLITILYFAVALTAGMLNAADSIGSKWQQIYYVGLFALQTFSQLSLAFMVSFFIRKAFLALGIFLFYFVVLENVFVALLRYYEIGVREFLPLEISDRLIPVPAFIGKFDKESYDKALDIVNIHILYTLLLTALIWWICFRVNNRKDL